MPMISSPIRVAIFEDNKLIRDAYEAILQNEAGFACVGVFADCFHLLERIDRAKPDVVLMDIELPGMDGIEATRLLSAHHPDLRILIQTVFEEDDKIFAAICAGASGYLLKSNGMSRLLEAVVEAYQGGSPMSTTVASRVLRLFQQIVPRHLASPIQADYDLSAREREILLFMTEGKDLRAIGEACFISYETVRTHVKKIYKKLHVASASEAVAKAIKQKLV